MLQMWSTGTQSQWMLGQTGLSFMQELWPTGRASPGQHSMCSPEEEEEPNRDSNPHCVGNRNRNNGANGRRKRGDRKGPDPLDTNDTGTTTEKNATGNRHPKAHCGTNGDRRRERGE